MHLFGYLMLIPIGAIVVSGLALFRRRQRPVVAFMASVVVAILFLAFDVPTGVVMVIPASYAVAVYVPAPRNWVVLVAGLGLHASAVWVLTAGGLLHSGPGAVWGVALAALLGAIVGQSATMQAERQQAADLSEKRRLADGKRQAELAVSRERERIAREMHDIVSHSLTVVVALAEGAAATPDAGHSRAATDAMAATARSALNEMRSILSIVRGETDPAPLTPLAPVSPTEVVRNARQAGFPVSLATHGEARLTSAVTHALGRIVQEGVTNAIRHAPEATTIAVIIDHSVPERLKIQVANDGVINSPPQGTGGYGIRGLQERVALLRGTLRSESDGPQQWILEAEIPTREPDGAAEERTR